MIFTFLLDLNKHCIIHVPFVCWNERKPISYYKSFCLMEYTILCLTWLMKSGKCVIVKEGIDNIAYLLWAKQSRYINVMQCYDMELRKNCRPLRLLKSINWKYNTAYKKCFFNLQIHRWYQQTRNGYIQEKSQP